MSSRYLGVITLERFLVAERYCESRQPSSSTDPGGPSTWTRTAGAASGRARGPGPARRPRRVTARRNLAVVHPAGP
jgi:hypothetical protein